MVAIDADAPRFTAVSSLNLDLDEPDVESVYSALVRRSEDRARSVPGFVSASILRRRPQDSETAVPQRLLEYSQWDSRDAHRRHAEALDSPVLRGVTLSQTDTYELDTVISPLRRLEIIASDPRLTMVVSMRARSGEQTFVNEYNQEETRNYFSKFAGFVGVAFHCGPGDLVLEYLQWESMSALEAASSTERFRTHMARNARHCLAVDFGVYDVLRTIPASTIRAESENGD